MKNNLLGIAGVNDKIGKLIRKHSRRRRVDFVSPMPIFLTADGFCENLGKMRLVIYAKQGGKFVFNETIHAGHGNCNVAKYLAVTTGLCLLRSLYPKPNVPVIVVTDSQLVDKQFSGEWRTSPGEIGDLCIGLRKLNRSYPFSLVRFRVPKPFSDGVENLRTDLVLKKG